MAINKFNVTFILLLQVLFIKSTISFKCKVGKYLDITCKNCHTTCKTCSGPKKKNCTSCKKDLYLHENKCLKSCP